jgi:uncharacterized protein YcfL
MKIFTLILTLSLFLFTGCGSDGSKATDETQVYSPPQPAVNNVQERPPAVPSI